MIYIYIYIYIYIIYFNNCLVSKNDVSSPSIDVVTLNSLSVQINNIKSLILDSNNIIKKNTTYADTLKSSNESSFSSMTSKINNIPSKITHTQIDDLSAIIKNISKSSCNMDYINDIFKYFGVDNAIAYTISDVKFINGTAIINFNSKYSIDRFLDLKFDDKYDKLFIFQSLSLDTRKLGLLYYRAIKSGSIKSLKSVFNKRTNCYELRRTINDKIDWISDKYNPTQEEISVWKISFAAFSKSKSETESNKK